MLDSRVVACSRFLFGGLDRLGIAASRIRGSSGLGLGVLASSYIEDLCILPVSLYLVSLLSAVPYN